MNRCQLCDAAIEWRTTPSGLRIPIDPRPSPRGPLAIEPATGCVRIIPTADRDGFAGVRYTSHWMTCPAAEESKRHAIEARRARAKRESR